jgi:hypothetical protein
MSYAVNCIRYINFKRKWEKNNLEVPKESEEYLLKLAEKERDFFPIFLELFDEEIGKSLNELLEKSKSPNLPYKKVINLRIESGKPIVSLDPIPPRLVFDPKTGELIYTKTGLVVGERLY